MLYGIFANHYTLGMCSDAMKDSPKEMMDFFVTLDPAFETELEVEDPNDLNRHRIMMIFAEYFAVNHRSFSRKQLRCLGEWLSTSVSAGGEIENAVSTCFLEHARQLKVNRVLAPYLSREAKEKTHA